MHKIITSKNTSYQVADDSTESVFFRGVEVAKHEARKFFVCFPGYFDRALMTRINQALRTFGSKSRIAGGTEFPFDGKMTVNLVHGRSGKWRSHSFEPGVHSTLVLGV